MLSASLHQQLIHHLSTQHLISEPYSQELLTNLSLRQITDLGVVTEEKLYFTIASITQMPFITLVPETMPFLGRAHIHFCNKHSACVIEYQDEVWCVMSDPWNVEVIDELSRHYDIDQVALGTPSNISHYLSHIDSYVQHDDQLTNLLAQAVRYDASDIHFLNHTKGILVQYRVKGRFSKSQIVNNDVWSALLNQIKVKSNLDISETRRAQSGHFKVSVSGQTINCRVATHPTVLSEIITIRLLYQKHKIDALHDLGFKDTLVTALQDITTHSAGLFLITGPTGSGKTTTLYSLFQDIKDQKKIMTLEDPVEYRMHDIQQTEIIHDDVFSYHDGLKSILRHDPDIIFIGEIRDEKTAKLALRASMTGHLVCATMHTFTPFDAVFRFLDFGVSQVHLASQLLGVLSQQLGYEGNNMKLSAELLINDDQFKNILMQKDKLGDLDSYISNDNYLKN